jgi:hypothetical protein
MSAQIRRLSSADPLSATLDALLAFEGSTDAAIEQAVADILQAVRRDGDAAVVEFTRRFDHLDVADMAALELPKAELEAALAGLSAEQRRPSKPPPPACAATTSARCSNPGATPTTRRAWPAPASGRRSRRWTASACTCRAAARPTPARC